MMASSAVRHECRFDIDHATTRRSCRCGRVEYAAFCNAWGHPSWAHFCADYPLDTTSISFFSIVESNPTHSGEADS